MYEYFRGQLIDKAPPFAIVEVHGIGYKLALPSNAFNKLPHPGVEVFLYTSWVVRETGQALYGFLAKEERDLFEILITLSGIGPKTALAILGHFELPLFAEAVHTGNVKAISQVPGIGKKTAERLLIDLKGKLNISSLPQSVHCSKIQDALNALLHLGCAPGNAEHAVKRALQELTEECDLPTLITVALKYRK